MRRWLLTLAWKKLTEPPRPPTLPERVYHEASAAVDLWNTLVPGAED